MDIAFRKLSPGTMISGLLVTVILTIIIQPGLIINPLVSSPQLAEAASGKIPNQYIVVLKGDGNSQSAADDARSKGAEVLHIYNHAIRGFAMKVPNEQALAAIQRNPNVAYVEQDQ